MAAEVPPPADEVKDWSHVSGGRHAIIIQIACSC